MIWTTPIHLGSHRVKNRIVFPPISANWAEADGSVTGRILNFYRDISRGGCGMTVLSGTAVSRDGKGSDRSLCLFDERHVEGFKRLAGIIRENGCFASIQLMHVGGQGNPQFTGFTPVSPSGLECRATGYGSRALTTDELREISQKFAASAGLASRAGFQAVELHLGHGYLLHEFLSEHANRRRDVYGGSAENRMRLVLEIIEGIRQEAPEILIGTRISGEDYLIDGINREVNRIMLPILEKAGVEYFSVTAGVYETSSLKHEAMALGKFFDYARDIKSFVSKPVIGAGKILGLESAEKHLTENDCDMVAIGRALVADPFMIEKVKKGELYNRCTECGECQYLRHHKPEMSCPQWETRYD